MSTNLTLAKLVLCAVGGAVIGGGAVHVAERPNKPKVHHVAQAKKRVAPKPVVPPPPASAPLICDPGDDSPRPPQLLAMRVTPAAFRASPAMDAITETAPTDEGQQALEELPLRLPKLIPPAVLPSVEEPFPGLADTVPISVPEAGAAGLLGLGTTLLLIRSARRRRS